MARAASTTSATCGRGFHAHQTTVVSPGLRRCYRPHAICSLNVCIKIAFVDTCTGVAFDHTSRPQICTCTMFNVVVPPGRDHTIQSESYESTQAVIHKNKITPHLSRPPCSLLHFAYNTFLYRTRFLRRNWEVGVLMAPISARRGRVAHHARQLTKGFPVHSRRRQECR